MNHQTTFTFKGEGHQQPGHKPSDLFVCLELVPPNPSSRDYYINSRYTLNHKNSFKDLYYYHAITLQEAIECKPVKVPLLSGESIMLPVD